MTEYPAARIQDGTISFAWTLVSSPGRVWQALTETESLSRWLAPHVVMELRTGGRTVLDWGSDGIAEGEVTRIEPEHLLEYSWGGSQWPETSVVRWEVESSGQGTRLLLTHRGLTGPDKRIKELAAGWHDFLDGLLDELGEKPGPGRYKELVREYTDS